MARALQAELDADLTQPAIRWAFLVELDFAEAPVRLWSGIGSLVYNGQTYTGVGYLGGISAITESGQGVTANGVALSLSGIPSSLLSIALGSNYQGRAVTIRLALFPSGATAETGDISWVEGDITWAEGDIGWVGATSGGSADDPWNAGKARAVVIFRGQMDVMEIDEGPETSTISITAENHLADLKRPRVRRYTHADQLAAYPDDMFLEFIDALQGAEIVWGPGSGGGASTQPPVWSSGTETPGYIEGGGGNGPGADSGRGGENGGRDAGGPGSQGEGRGEGGNSGVT